MLSFEDTAPLTCFTFAAEKWDLIVIPDPLTWDPFALLWKLLAPSLFILVLWNPMLMCLGVDSWAHYSESFPCGDSSSLVLNTYRIFFLILPFLCLSWLVIGPTVLILWFSHNSSSATHSFVLLFYFLGDSLNINFQPSNDFFHFCYNIFNF